MCGHSIFKTRSTNMKERICFVSSPIESKYTTKIPTKFNIREGLLPRASANLGILSFETSPWFFFFFNDTWHLSRRKARKIIYESQVFLFFSNDTWHLSRRKARRIKYEAWIFLFFPMIPGTYQGEKQEK